jgi:phthalate 4,5-dioxygenase oxygenase subunit
MVICTSYRTDRAFKEEEVAPFKKGLESHRTLVPGTTTPLHGPHDNYGQDRERQRNVNFSGMPGIRDEDAAMIESAGAVSDRSKEHLGTSDTAVIRMRLLMLKGAKDLMRGIEPKAAQGGKLYAVRSHSVVIDEPVDFDQKEEIMEAMAV